jgi:hypothetical protein
MLAKIIDYNKCRVRVTQLDIDDYGSIIPVGDVELLFSQNNPNVYELLKNSTYAAIFTEKDIYNEGSVDLRVNVNLDNIILVIPMTIDELNDEKNKVIESAGRYKE